MAVLDQLQGACGASPAQKAIRAGRALTARREFGLVANEGNTGGFWQWLAWKRGDGPQRQGLEPLAVVEAILWARLFELEGGGRCG